MKLPTTETLPPADQSHPPQAEADGAGAASVGGELEIMTGETPQLKTMARADGPAIFAEFEKEAEPLFANALAISKQEITPVVADLAAGYRKQIKKVRCAAEARRKELTEGIKRQAKAIDQLAGKIWDTCEAAEKKLLEIEEYAERQEIARLDAIVADRSARVREAEGNPSHYALRDMDEAAFQEQLSNLLAGQTARKAAAIKALLRDKRCEQMEEILERPIEKKEGDAWVEMTEIDFEAALIDATESRAERMRLAEEARKAEEAAREAQRLENERLRRLADEQEAQLAKEREEAAAKLRAEQEAARIEREKLETAAKAERAAAAARQREIEEKAEQERQQAEERARIAKAENDRRLKEIADATEKQRKADEEAARLERAAALKKWQAAQDLAAEEQRKREALEQERAEREAKEREAEEERQAQERAAAAAPDREKLEAYAAALRAVPYPAMATEAGQSLLDEIEGKLLGFASQIDKRAAELSKPKKGAKAAQSEIPF